jgi:hypothetical protein
MLSDTPVGPADSKADTPGENGFSSRNSPELERRPVLVRLRSGRTVDGSIHISRGQPLIDMLAMKKSYLNLTGARWSEDGDRVPHLSLRVQEILWVMPRDGALILSSAAPTSQSPRKVELHLVDGSTLTVTVGLASELRMSDYFESSPSFLPIWDVSGAIPEESRRLAVYEGAIMAIREL